MSARPITAHQDGFVDPQRTHSGSTEHHLWATSDSPTLRPSRLRAPASTMARRRSGFTGPIRCSLIRTNSGPTPSWCARVTTSRRTATNDGEANGRLVGSKLLETDRVPNPRMSCRRGPQYIRPSGALKGASRR